MLKISENNGTEEIGLVTPTPVQCTTSVIQNIIFPLVTWAHNALQLTNNPL